MVKRIERKARGGKASLGIILETGFGTDKRYFGEGSIDGFYRNRCTEQISIHHGDTADRPW